MSALLVVVLLTATPGEPSLAPLESSSPPSLDAAPTRGGRVAAELGAHLGITVGAGVVGGLMAGGGAALARKSGLELIGVSMIGASIGLGLALLLSPLYLTPLHQRMSGRGLARDAWLGLLAGTAVSAMTLPLALLVRNGTGGAATYATSLVGFAAPVVGLEFGDLLASEAAVMPTVTVATGSASVGLSGRW